MKKLSKLLKNLAKNYTIISFGYTCIPKLFFNPVLNQETYLFDWLGSDLWSIYEIISQDFPILTNPEDFFIYDIASINPDQPFVITNKKYFLRFLHDFDHQEPIIKFEKEFHQKYLRRSERFKKLLQSQEPIIFFHYEDNNPRRFPTLYDQIKKYYPNSLENYSERKSKINLEYAIKIINLIRDKYQKDNFYLVYLSNSFRNTFDPSNQLIILNHSDHSNQSDKKTQLKIFQETFIKNYNYLRNILLPNKNN